MRAYFLTRVRQLPMYRDNCDSVATFLREFPKTLRRRFGYVLELTSIRVRKHARCRWFHIIIPFPLDLKPIIGNPDHLGAQRRFRVPTYLENGRQSKPPALFPIRKPNSLVTVMPAAAIPRKLPTFITRALREFTTRNTQGITHRTNHCSSGLPHNNVNAIRQTQIPRIRSWDSAVLYHLDPDAMGETISPQGNLYPICNAGEATPRWYRCDTLASTHHDHVQCLANTYPNPWSVTKTLQPKWQARKGKGEKAALGRGRRLYTAAMTRLVPCGTYCACKWRPDADAAENWGQRKNFSSGRAWYRMMEWWERRGVAPGAWDDECDLA